MDDKPDQVRRIIFSSLSDCSRCDSAYRERDLRLVGRNGNLWVFCLRCVQCEALLYVAAVIGDLDDDEIEVTRLDQELERDSWSDADELTESAVSIDDVLDMHEFLDSFNGNFTSLFSRRRG